MHPNWLGQPNATLTVGAAGRGLVGAREYIKKWPLKEVVGWWGGGVVGWWGGGWIDRYDCNPNNWSRVRIPKTWIQFFLAKLANFYESLKRNNRGEGQKPLGK